MDKSIINQARLAYFFGNYQKVLDIWSANDIEDLYFNFIVARSLIASRELKPKAQQQITKKPSQQLLQVTEIVTRFLAPVLKPTRPNTTVEEDARMIEEALKKIKDSFDESTQYNSILKIICCYLSINANEVYYVLQQNVNNQKDYLSMEILFLQLMCFLRGKNQDQAGKILTILRQIDDEDVLLYLGQIYFHFYNNQPIEALQCINQAKERFGESAKLMNLMVSALISQNKFEDAFVLASKLQQALLEKEQFSDRQEIETCFSNLLLLAEICGKSSVKDECIEALQTLNPSSLSLKLLRQKYEMLNQAFA